VRELGALMAALQGTSPFPVLADYPVIVARMFDRLRTSGMFGAGLLDPHAEALARIRELYPWEASAHVSAHNDPNPRNLIYDGERIWLVDWETAYRNDAIVDLAILADSFAPTAALEDALLSSWLGREPRPEERARLTVMRPLTRLYYAGLLLMGFASAPREAPDGDLRAPTPDEFRTAILEGRLRPASPEAMYVLGKMCLAGFLEGVGTPAMEGACATLRAG
jgi:Ser/Thr protein kinase RdoA (MazF antagonist)